MSRSSVIKRLVSICLCLYFGIAQAEENLYVFVFKEGAAQPNIVVNVGGTQSSTNEFGLASFDLKADEYEVSYYKDNELFALTEVNLVENQQSQVFLSLTKAGADVELDLPLAAYEQNFEQAEIKEQTGPKGILKLQLLDDKSGEPIVGARLFFKGYAVEATSDEQGLATVDLSEGVYDISVIHPKFIMRVLKDVSVKAEAVAQQDVKMLKADIIMEEFVVSAPAVEGSLASTFTALKESDVIGDALSAEEFSKSGDSSAADALKRVTGITIVDGKYVYVRGLGERYSTILLNGLYIPSPEPTKRVVPLDIFPSSVIQSMDIQKTYTADLPGTFGGGDVLIETKDIPEEDNYAKLTVGTAFSQYTGKDMVYNPDNRSPMPQNIIDKSANFQDIQQGFPNLNVPGYSLQELYEIDKSIVNYRSYGLSTTKLKPGTKLGLDVGQSFKSSGGIKYGVVGSLYISSDQKGEKGTIYTPVYTDELLKGERSDYSKTTITDKQGGLISLGFEDRLGNSVKYTFLSVNVESDSTYYTERDANQEGVSEGDKRRTYLQYSEKTITSHQLAGEHEIRFGWFENDLINDANISWAWGSSESTRSEPGTVDYEYYRDNSFNYVFDDKTWFLYSDLSDELDNYRVDVKFPYTIGGQEAYTELGVFNLTKNRYLDNRRFKFQHNWGNNITDEIDTVFIDQNVNLGDKLFSSNYRSDDAYTATEEQDAFYIKQLYPVTERFEILASLRQEDSRQQLVNLEDGVPYDPLETSDSLMSFSANYNISDDHVVRAGFANTLSRPDFREFSPNRYKDPITGDIVFGYEDLKYTTIDNIDLKYEWYMSYDEMAAVGLFQKNFTYPVETVVIDDPDAQGGTKKVSFRNADSATSTGVEFSIRKKLGIGSSSTSTSNYFVSSNLAFIDSAVKIHRVAGDEFLENITTLDRPMQGQSPYVVNINFGYDNLNTGRSAIFAYNEFGKRIVKLGSFGAPDFYEQPFKKLDFVVKWRLNDTYDEQIKKIGYSLGFKATNLLDSSVDIYQGNILADTHKPGRTYSLSFSAKY